MLRHPIKRSRGALPTAAQYERALEVHRVNLGLKLTDKPLWDWMVEAFWWQDPGEGFTAEEVASLAADGFPVD